MRGLTGVGPLVWERLLANWRLLLVLTFGILMAATLLAASPIYTRVMSDLGLNFSLKEGLRSASRNSLIQFGLPLGSEEASTETNALGRAAAEEISWFTGSEARYSALTDLTLAYEGQPVATDRFRTTVTLQALSGLDAHVRVVQGRMPLPTSDPSRIEVALPAETAAYLRAKPGDKLLAVHSFDDCNRPPPTDDANELRDRARFRCTPEVLVTLEAPLTVTGIIEPLDPAEVYWSAGRPFFDRPSATDERGAIVPVVLPEESFSQALPRLLPRLPYEYRLTGFTDVSRLNSANLARARSSLAALRQRVTERHGLADLPMAAALQDFHSRASFNQVPLLLLLLQVVGIALYYVLLVASMLAERRAEEIAMLRSRGASVGQVVAMAAIEASLLAGGVVLVAPFLAAGAVAVLGKTGTFETVSGGHYLTFKVLPAAFGFAAGGAALAVMAIIVPTFFAARRGIVHYLQGAARPGKPLLQRYYIDLGLAGLAALGLWELNQRGSVFDPRSVGGWSADPLLLVSPLLIILAVGALMFRFLPLLLSFVSRFASVTAGPGIVLGLWQLTRSPARYTQLALLVVMAGAVGTFAATYGETTDRSQEDRARFEAGVDVRTQSLGKLAGLSSSDAATALRQVPGVEGAAAAYRGSLGLGPLPIFGNGIGVLGIDPEAAPSLLWFRDDFADEPLGSLLRHAQGSPSGGSGMVLPGEPVAVSVWVNPSPARDASTLWLRSVDAAGTFRLHELGTIDYTGYRQLTARLSKLDDIHYPIALAGLVITQPANMTDATRGGLFFDDVSVVDESGAETVVEDFEGPFRWEAIRTATRNRDTVTQAAQGVHRGVGAAQYSFRIGGGVSIRGMYPGDPNIPLPAVVSNRFLERTGARVGSEVELVIGSVVVPLAVRGTTDLFPTMDDSGEGFVIVNQEHLYYYSGLTAQKTAGGPTEVWLKLSDDPQARAEAVAAISKRFDIPQRQFIDVNQVIEHVKTDPVVRAGGSGVLLIALVAAFAILALGFALTLYIGGQIRTVEVSVMRAVGFSRRQVFIMVGLEYLLVGAIGLVIGVVAGLRISETMLSFLNVTEQGARLVPPFALATRWDTVGVAFAATGVAFLVGVLLMGLYFLRLPVSRILRLTR